MIYPVMPGVRLVVSGALAMLLLSCPLLAGTSDAQSSCADLSYTFSSLTTFAEGAAATFDSPVAGYFQILSPGPDIQNQITATINPKTDYSMSLNADIPNKFSLFSNRSLLISMPPVVDTNSPEKAIVSAVGHHEFSAAVNGPPALNSLTFDFKLAPNYQNPTFWVIHMQAFQCCSPGIHPPLDLDTLTSSKTAGPVTMEVRVRDDNAERNSVDMPIKIGQFPVTRGVWHHAVFWMSPSPDTSGYTGIVLATLDGKIVASYVGHWGYTLADFPNTRIGFDLGIYRRTQMTSQTISLDNIVYQDAGCGN